MTSSTLKWSIMLSMAVNLPISYRVCWIKCSHGHSRTQCLYWIMRIYTRFKVYRRWLKSGEDYQIFITGLSLTGFLPAECGYYSFLPTHLIWIQLKRLSHLWSPGCDQIALMSSEKQKVETVIHMLWFGRLSIPQSPLKRFMAGIGIASIFFRCLF